MADFLFEIGHEEIPASYLKPAVEQMARIAEEQCNAKLIKFKEIKTYYTPRRLILHITEVSEKTEVAEVIYQGPPARIAFNESNEATRAAEGFAKKQGVNIEDLEIKEGYVVARKKVGGEPTILLLGELCESIVRGIKFPKTMRWEMSGFKFARPLRWLLALFGDETINFAVADVQSGNFTYGHRFLSGGRLEVKNTADYFERLRTARVEIDPLKRRQQIKEQLASLALTHQADVRIDEDLLNETADLVEYPVVSVGRYAGEFLKVPAPVLITAMKKHQKYFPFYETDGSLKPLFATVNNIPASGEDLITSGNEKVLQARLADARFFFAEDSKRKLSQKVDGLKKVVFHEELGSIYDKCGRLESTVRLISELVRGQETHNAVQAASLCKVDLLTNMVYEFPELQGVMGQVYALADGEPALVAQAMYEHYLPRFNGDELPLSEAGAILSIAEKCDNIVACFGLGLIPSGSQDPYALRRQALGIVQIILANKWNLPLKKIVFHLLTLMGSQIKQPAKKVVTEVLDFIKQRLQFILNDEIPYDVLKAALGQDRDDLADLCLRARVVNKLKSEDGFESMMASYRRVVNILKSAEPRLPEPDAERFETSEEKILMRAVDECRDKFFSLVADNKYHEAFELLKPLQAPIDNFFDAVMVMVEDAAVRENRFALLGSIAGLFSEVADFSEIVLA